MLDDTPLTGSAVAGMLPSLTAPPTLRRRDVGELSAWGAV